MNMHRRFRWRKYLLRKNLPKYFIGMLAVMVCCSITPVGAGELLILTEDGIPPFNFKKDGQLVGASTEIVEEILRRLDLDLTIDVVPWARGYQIALQKPNVILFSMARSKDRENLFHWVGPICRVQSAFYASRGSMANINSLADARRVRSIGTYRDDVREAYLLKKGFTNLEITNSNQSNLRKLLSGRIDLWATSNIEAANLPEQLGIDPAGIKHVFTFQKFELYIAISKKTSMTVVKAWQTTLDQMKSEGIFTAISRRWLPEDSLPEDVSRATPSSDAREKISIYTENSPPGNYVQEGALKGPAIRVVQEILRRLSINSPIEVVPWARGYHLARTQPNVALFSTSRLPQRETVFKWVGPLYTQRWGFYARRTADTEIDSMDAAKKVGRIGTYHEDAKEQYLKSLGFENLVSTNNNIGNVRHLMAGTIDMWVSSDFNMPYIVRYAGEDPRQLKLVLSFKTVGNYIAFSRQTPDPIVAQWQQVLDDIRRDGTWAQYFEIAPGPVD
jgi:polar amino acid transport system substrate-binding protein